MTSGSPDTLICALWVLPKASSAVRDLRAFVCSLIRPNSISRNGRTVVDRGTQTVVHPQLFLPSGLTLHDGAARISGHPSLFTLSPAKVSYSILVR